MSSRFYFGASSSSSRSSLSSNDGTSLPFPAPLDRAAFLTPTFDATTFLSSLTARFQTLEDLQTELSDLSQSLNKELVDLVNDNYREFLALGSTLSGGEERIEEIRVGLLGFQRDVAGLRAAVETREEQVRGLMERKRSLRREIGVGRDLLELSQRVDALEVKMGLGQGQGERTTRNMNAVVERGGGGDEWGHDWDVDLAVHSDEEEYDDDDATGLPPRLRRRVDEFLIVALLASRHSPQHPFVTAEQNRIRRIREILLLDMDAAIKAEPEVKVKQKIMRQRELVDE